MASRRQESGGIGPFDDPRYGPSPHQRICREWVAWALERRVIRGVRDGNRAGPESARKAHWVRRPLPRAAASELLLQGARLGRGAGGLKVGSRARARGL